MQEIINGEMYEVEPAVKVIIDKLMIENAELKKENARLEEGYQKSLGVIAATNCVKCKKDAEPVKHARWVKTGRTNGYGDTEYKCLNCQTVIYVPDDSMCMIVREKYCFNCGCKMTLKGGESK